MIPLQRKAAWLDNPIYSLNDTAECGFNSGFETSALFVMKWIIIVMWRKSKVQLSSQVQHEEVLCDFEVMAWSWAAIHQHCISDLFKQEVIDVWLLNSVLISTHLLMDYLYFSISKSFWSIFRACISQMTSSDLHSLVLYSQDVHRSWSEMLLPSKVVGKSD